MKTDIVSDTEKLKMRITQFADWAVRAMVAGCFMFVWGMYEKLQTFSEHQIKTDSNIIATDTRVTQLEKDLARVEGNMVSIETLKRVEIYLELVLTRSGTPHPKVDLTSGNGKR